MTSAWLCRASCDSWPHVGQRSGTKTPWLVLGGLPVVAGLAESSSTGGVVGVESSGDEVSSADWVVVGDGAGCLPAEDALWVAGEDCCAEGAVSCGVVAAGSSCLVGLAAVLVAAS